MLSCKKITELCSRELERRLNLGERAALRAHLVDVRGLREFSQTAAGAARLGPHLCPWQCAAARRSRNLLRDGRPGQLSLRARSHFSADAPLAGSRAQRRINAFRNRQATKHAARCAFAGGVGRGARSRVPLGSFHLHHPEALGDSPRCLGFGLSVCVRGAVRSGISSLGKFANEHSRPRRDIADPQQTAPNWTRSPNSSNAFLPRN